MADYIFITFIIFFFIQFALLIPSFFFYRKKIKLYKSKNINFFSILAVVIMPIVYTSLLILLIGFIIDPIFRAKKFETKEWVENADSRYRMVNDLKNNNLLTGKTKNEVIKMLGNDYHENCWLKNTLCYATADPNSFGSFDHYELVIYFKNGLVSKIESQLI